MEKTAFTLVGIFLITQVLGLYGGNIYSQAIQTGKVPPPIENPEAIENSFWFFGWILIGTLMILLIIRFKRNLIKGLEALVVFIASWFAFDFLFPVGIWYLSLGFFLALILTAWKMLRPTILSQNTAAIFAGAGAGAVIGASFGIVPSIILMILLCVYDFISVFITKHMVKMAKAITETPTAFTIATPHKFKKPKYIPHKKSRRKIHVFQLGVGDIVIPLIFSISILSKFTILHSILTVIGSAIALTGLIYYMTKKPQALPALPFITLGTLSSFIISVILL